MRISQWCSSAPSAAAGPSENAFGLPKRRRRCRPAKRRLCLCEEPYKSTTQSRLVAATAQCQSARPHSGQPTATLATAMRAAQGSHTMCGGSKVPD